MPALAAGAPSKEIRPVLGIEVRRKPSCLSLYILHIVAPWTAIEARKIHNDGHKVCAEEGAG